MGTTAWYTSFAKRIAHFCGRPRTFVLAVLVIATWIITGPIFDFSDTQEFRKRYQALAATARINLDRNEADIGSPEP